MNPRQTELSYRRAAVQNASSVGLVVILYDLLIQDLREAVEAIAKKDIEARSAAIKHAFRVLQQLEGSLDHENGAEAAQNLSRFYSVMRNQILQGHIRIDAAILNEQVGLLLDVRAAWEQVDPAKQAPNPLTAPDPTITSSQLESSSADWTA
jgi:flagellar protein FliS